jgi:GTP-binding protein LepA
MAPDPALVRCYEEPLAEATIMCPSEFKSAIITLCHDRMGTMITTQTVENSEILRYRFPMSEIITDFFDKIKSLTKGYGSLEYEFTG